MFSYWRRVLGPAAERGVLAIVRRGYEQCQRSLLTLTKRCCLGGNLLLARPVESQSPSQAKPNLPEINVQRCVRTYDKVRAGLRWRMESGFGGGRQQRRLRQEIWNLLEVPPESSSKITRCCCLRQIQFQSMHFRLESNSFLFSCQRLSLEILHVFNASCHSKSRSIIFRFHWGFFDVCVSN